MPLQFLECSDIPALAESLDTGVFSSKFKKLTAEICEAVDDYGLLDFVPLRWACGGCERAISVWKNEWESRRRQDD